MKISSWQHHLWWLIPYFQLAWLAKKFGCFLGEKGKILCFQTNSFLIVYEILSTQIKYCYVLHNLKHFLCFSFDLILFGLCFWTVQKSIRLESFKNTYLHLLHLINHWYFISFGNSEIILSYFWANPPSSKVTKLMKK